VSAAKHTPGAWYSREWNTHDKTTVLVDAPESFLKVRQIAECEEEADALLIAAAPDLLRELQHAVHWFDQITPEDVARYRSAIAKATGVLA
jgi:hypothetical protein